MTSFPPTVHSFPVQRRAQILGFFVCSAPLLVFTLTAWTSIVLLPGALLSLFLLAGGELPATRLAATERRWFWILAVTLVAPILAAALSALMRGDRHATQFDAPSRFLAALPILVFVLRSRVSAARALQWVLPVAVLVGLAVLQVFGADPKWGPGRDTTHFVDPLVFGYLNLSFALMCLITLEPGDWREGRRWSVVLRVIGVLVGLLLSVRSGSRTGWLAVPIVVAVWLYFLWGVRNLWATVAALVAAALFALLAYFLLPPVSQRINQAVMEVVSYPWHGVAPDSSVGWRISFLRMAVQLIAHHPWEGIGDTSHMPTATLPTFAFASPASVEHAFHSAFHNQIVSNAVRMGVGGLVATAALLLVPLMVCTRALRRDGPRAHPDAAMGFAFFTCMFVSSMSTEIVDLKFMASLYAVMTAVLCGAVLARRRGEP